MVDLLAAARAMAENFLFPGEILTVTPHGSGKINDTFLVVTSNGKFILQRLNPVVFARPELVMHNLRTIESHITKRLREDPALGGRRWETPAVVTTRSGGDLIRDAAEGAAWRALTFIDHAAAFETLQGRNHAQQTGWALGRFHRLLRDLPVASLFDPLPDFHITPRYLARFDAVAATSRRSRGGAEGGRCLDFIAGRRGRAAVLEEARQRGEIPLRAVHGDPKVSNIMIDSSTGEAVGFVDLDTVKPGLIHYDIGDCLRSSCNTAGEEATPAREAVFDPDICALILESYLAEARDFVSRQDLAYFYDAIWLIPFELGLRFLTDHLAGDTYFKTSYPAQNLDRALIQFSLCQSIERQEKRLRAMIHALS